MEYRTDIKTILSDLNDEDLEDLCQSLEKLHSIFAKINVGNHIPMNPAGYQYRIRRRGMAG